MEPKSDETCRTQILTAFVDADHVDHERVIDDPNVFNQLWTMKSDFGCHLCLLKSPFLLRQLMLQPTMDTVVSQF